ncbi:hypothetical protein MLD38_001512 [Melastoma candidum]|uniref:Uncharacterized protein n=1 Tax=Melastoma candidum TaxID=119954 RepID=A0ACB9SM50_9MYRT|nr:hypothetical protein MLD38_001512 [Melastoma candidum]
METVSGLVAATTTPSKEQLKGQSRLKNYQESPAASENMNPNLRHPGMSPNEKGIGSPVDGSAKSRKSAPRNPGLSGKGNFSARSRIRERKFIVVKKNSRKEGEGTKVACSKCRDVRKCLCVAYENLRASQEDFFKIKDVAGGTEEPVSGHIEDVEGEDIEKSLMMHDLGNDVGDGQEDGVVVPECSVSGEIDEENGVSTIKRRRDKLMEAARNSIPDEGRVMHLVKAFEKLRTLCDPRENDNADKKVVNWALPGLLPPKESLESKESLPSISHSNLLLTAENLGLDPRASLSSSWDSESCRTSVGGRRSRRTSLESRATTGGGRRLKKKQHQRMTSQKPFQLRTEQRGRLKEEELVKKIQETMLEEERRRIPIAHGLPWTTDEPECLVKPAVKENTRPLDLRLHTDIRALERVEFDQQVAAKLSLLEQYKAEKERQQKLEEEEEIKRLRKELVPKAQPMPYFDRPFIPRRSTKNPTIPREPRFHIPQHKKIKSCLSWNDMSQYSFQL